MFNVQFRRSSLQPNVETNAVVSVAFGAKPIRNVGIPIALTLLWKATDGCWGQFTHRTTRFSASACMERTVIAARGSAHILGELLCVNGPYWRRQEGWRA